MPSARHMVKNICLPGGVPASFSQLFGTGQDFRVFCFIFFFFFLKCAARPSGLPALQIVPSLRPEPGFKRGFNPGFEPGFESGFEPGFKSGFKRGFKRGFESGFKSGFESGFKPDDDDDR